MPEKEDVDQLPEGYELCSFIGLELCWESQPVVGKLKTICMACRRPPVYISKTNFFKFLYTNSNSFKMITLLCSLISMKKGIFIYVCLSQQSNTIMCNKNLIKIL